jgi:RimJ/RimL family protein N-acetyltransferase
VPSEQYRCQTAAVEVSLRTDRLILTEAGPDDVDGLLAVALSNPAFLATHEGSGGEPGAFDRSMLERDLAVADLDPQRHSLVLRRRRDGEVVGWADLLDEHPRDGVPWIGLLELRADVQQQGLGREAAQALARWYAGSGASALRVGVDDGNDAAATFWRSLGYRPVDRRERPSPVGALGVEVLELSLDEAPSTG